MKAQMTQAVTIAQAKTALEQTAALYFSKDGEGRYRMERRRARPVCLMGPAGLGKTEIVRQVANERGLAFLSYSITHHTRQSAAGLPRLCQRSFEGAEVTVTEYTMSEIIAQVYQTMEESGRREGILFLDEFNCASESLRPAMLQLLQDKSFGPHAIPDGWMLVLAGNPAEYNASAIALDAVTADRMRLLWLRPDYNAWRDYISTRGIHPVILSYLDDHKKHFYQFEKGSAGTGLVTARGWEDLSVMLRLMEESGYPIDLPFVAQYLQSSAVAREFITYYKQYEALFASGIVEDLLLGAHTQTRSTEVAAMSFQDRWALTSVVLSRLERLCAKGEQSGAEAMEQVLTFFGDCLQDTPQLEFLLGGITASDVCAETIVRHGCKAYRTLAGKVFFGTLPTDRSLCTLVKNAG